MSAEKSACAVCKKISSLKCGRCRSVSYCSKEHQKVDWKLHRKNCEEIALECCQVAVDRKLGRHLISTRFILPGEIVLEEAPILSGPMDVTPPVCLGCYKKLNTFNSRDCSRCSWPVCSDTCEKSPAHKPECEIARKCKKEKVSTTGLEAETLGHLSIMILRCLHLKESDPEAWEKINKLESHSEERKKSETQAVIVNMVSEFIPRFFNYHDFTREEILKLTGILEVNGHFVPLQNAGYVSIYDKASLLEHNCRANCSKSFSEDGKIVIRAARAIQKGEHLSISYTEPLWGRQQRQDYLLETKYFLCECDRCSDPTELGTNFNSFKCTSPVCNGYVVPCKDPTTLKFQWACNSCERINNNEELTSLYEQMKEGMSTLNKSDPESCKEFLINCGKYLNKNHYFIVEVKIALLEYYEGEKMCRASDEDLSAIITSCKELIDLTARLVPAENRLRGSLYFRLHSYLVEQGRRKSLSGGMDGSQFQQNLQLYKDTLNKAYSFLKFEPEIFPEGKMAAEALNCINDINKIMGVKVWHLLNRINSLA